MDEPWITCVVTFEQNHIKFWKKRFKKLKLALLKHKGASTVIKCENECKMLMKRFANENVVLEFIYKM